VKTYWSNGVWVSPLTSLKILFGFLQMFGLVSFIGQLPCVHGGCNCLGYDALDIPSANLTN